MSAEPSDGWHLDKKVPISIIVAILIQFGGGLWFVSRLDARIIALEAAQVMQADRDNRQDSSLNNSLTLLRSDMRDINNKLDRLIETRGNR